MNVRAQTLTALVAFAILGGCTSTHYVSIRHPLQVGQVDPNSVPFNARREERPRSLPQGVLTDEASLTEVTPERICVHTNLWQLDQVDPGRGQYENYNIALLNDVDGVENRNGQVQPEQPVTQQYQGTIQRRIPAGTRRVCAARRNRVCVRWTRQQVYRTVNMPHVWQVFAGRIPEATEAVDGIGRFLASHLGS